MAHELPYIAAIDEAIHARDGARRQRPLLRPEHGHDRERAVRRRVRQATACASRRSPRRPRSAWRSAPRWPASGPVVELYMAEFMLVAMDQVVNEGTALPRHDRRPGEGADRAQGRLRLHRRLGRPAHRARSARCSWACPGLKVVVPSTAADAKGLMATAIRDDNPVVYLHHYLLTLEHGEVPDGEYLVPFGQAAIRREGSDVTIVAHRLDGRPRARRGRAAGRRGHPGRGDRPAHARAARHEDDPRVGREDRPPRARRPGDAARVGLDRDRRRGRRARVLVAQGTDRAGHRARRDGALQRAARGVRHAERGQDRRRRAAGARLRRP